MKIIDLHCDALMHLNEDKRYSLYENHGHIDLKKLSAGGVCAQCFAIFLPQSDNENDTSAANFKLLKKQYKIFVKQMHMYSGLICQAVTKNDIIQNQNTNKISAILTVENGDFIGNDLSRLNVIKSMGVRMLGLTWNFENSLGYPNSADDKHNLPLKSLGIEAVEMLNNLDIIIDVSHLNAGGFWDVARCSKKPFVASHSCCDALFRHPRNLSDEQLRAVADSGGVVGICFYADFMKKSPAATFTKDIVNQALHIKNIAGIDAVSFGSDFDGMDSMMQFKDCSGFGMIVEELLKHFTQEECEKICYKNALRVLGN